MRYLSSLISKRLTCASQPSQLLSALSRDITIPYIVPGNLDCNPMAAVKIKTVSA